MPSGISHILLSNYLLNKLESVELKKILAAGSSFLCAGSVGPDLPYASSLDSDLFFSTQSDIADDFHYRSTNQVPLKAFHWIKQNITKATANLRKLDAHFSFFLGFSTHVIADGIIHPYVRDHVGEYKGNESEHRALEMCLDVLLYQHLTRNSGEYIDLNYSNFHDRLKELDKDKNQIAVMKLFSSLIKEVYNKKVSAKTVAGWAIGLHRLFSVAEGKHPSIYREPDASSSFFFHDASDLELKRDKYLILKKPKHWQDNFIKKESISFLDDCVPQYFSKMKFFCQRAYSMIYENGPDLTESDLPAVNLDNGRLLADQNKNSTSAEININTPYFWR